MIRQLGHYVEANCKDDMATFLSSGFAPIARPGASRPVSTHISSVDNGLTGQMIVRAKSSRNTHSLQVRYAPAGAGGAPGTWVTESFTNGRSMAIYGLTPGTNYTFQVRALGSLGQSDWSDAVTRMCI